MTRTHRALRAAALAAVAGPALWLAAPGAAHAHGGGLEVRITGQSFGHLAATVTWAGDGDPVDERVAATVNAVSADGRTALGPWRLVRADGTATGYTTAEALPPGRWKVTVEVGHPGLGRAQAQVTVEPGTPASSPPVGPSGPPAGPPTAAAPTTGTAAPGTAAPTAPATAAGTASGAAEPDGAAADAGPSGGGTGGPGPSGSDSAGAVAVAGGLAAVAVAAGGTWYALARRRRARDAAGGGTPSS
ncbi:hypothetical protein [Streptomyces fradiae]|uniref:hypothetical protein n=1 Tax=Streptomyces fradiae TaxID=1906 RepID=UPI002943BD78|nr:hypothetical protein [Streptomyces fradiae]WOI61850.1 hypothetical protein RYQ63_19165 [Streptomyces fradiae]